MKNDMYIAGDPYVLCQRTGFKVRKSQVVREWTGLRVLKGHEDQRHPSDKKKALRDKQVFRRAVPEPSDIFLALNQVTKDSF